MRDLSSALLEAQRAASGEPYVRVDVVERVGGLTRLNWERLYEGGEPESFHSAAVAGDGSLNRIWADPDSYDLWSQRVTSPGEGSAYSNWAKLHRISLQLDGVDAHLNCGNDSELAPTAAITVEAWVKPDTTTKKMDIVSKRAEWNRQYSLFLYDNNKFYFRIGNGTDIKQVSASCPGEEWIHVVGTYDGEEMAIYVNGAQGSTYPTERTIDSGDANLYIGRQVNYGYWEGQTGEVRVYNCALSPEEIVDNMNGRVTTEGLVLWLPIREGSGGTAADISGNGNDGALYGGPTWLGQGARACAICSHESKAFMFRVGASDGHLYLSESNDNGASWGGCQDLGDINGDEGTRLACCFKDTDEAIILYSDATQLYRRRWDGAGWETAAACPTAFHSISGIAVTYNKDWDIILTGAEDGTQNPGAWCLILGDGYSAASDSWTSPQQLAIAAEDSDLSFHFPALTRADVFRCFFVEAYAGGEEYSRPNWSHSLLLVDFIVNLWREPVPFNLSSEYGLALCYKNPDLWLARPDGVWRASRLPSSVALTQDVLELKQVIEPLHGEVEITLRNDDGRYNGIGQAGDECQAITKGSEIMLSFGFHTASGTETAGVEPLYWITELEFATEGGRSTLTIRGRDGWHFLERWRARRQFTWGPGEETIYGLIVFLFSRIGLDCSCFSSSSAINGQFPAFTINAGESGKAAIRRLLRMVPDVPFFIRDVCYFKNPLLTDPGVYSYGTDHPILEASFRDEVRAANRVQVFGDGVFTEDWDWEEIGLVYDMLSQASDLNLDTAAEAHQRGEAMLRGAGLGSKRGRLTVPMNCGQELFDVVEVTSPQTGLDASKRRVLSLTRSWSPSRARYALIMKLGSV